VPLCRLPRKRGWHERTQENKCGSLRLFGKLGDANEYQRVNAFILDAFLCKQGAGWKDLPRLLVDPGWTITAVVNPDIIYHVSRLAPGNPEEHRKSYEWLLEFLAERRRNWNDLTELLRFPKSPTWADDSSAGTGVAGDAPLPDLIHAVFERYVWMQPHQLVGVTLWTLHTHVYARYWHTPRLALTSPTNNCGKTTVLKLLSRLTPRARKTDSITPAVMYRLIDAEHPTLLLDEGDNMDFTSIQGGILKSVFNGGHEQDGSRTLMDRGAPRVFSTFTPMAVGGIGTFPRPFMSRALVVPMQRYDGVVKLERLELRDFDTIILLNAIYARILEWAKTIELNLNPPMPKGLRNRLTDNWRVLFAIADSFNSEWGELARNAARDFSHQHRDEDPQVLLLEHCREVFNARQANRLPSKIIVADLPEIDPMWSEWRGLKGDQSPRNLSQGELAKMLRMFGIVSRSIWPLGKRGPKIKSCKGYFRSQFEAAWRSYCPEDGTPAQPSNIRVLRGA
jgi:hypothetical protein